jgi:hypothetical protein
MKTPIWHVLILPDGRDPIDNIGRMRGREKSVEIFTQNIENEL